MNSCTLSMKSSTAVSASDLFEQHLHVVCLAVSCDSHSAAAAAAAAAAVDDAKLGD
jgi:hypothetical protein